MRNSKYILLSIALLAGCVDTDPVQELRSRPHQSNAGLDWRDQVIYQIMIDRWDSGDQSNDFNVEPNIPARYHGGDWRGVINRLDYLEELGVTALWISPVVRNVEDDAGFASYHGYWAQDLLRPNPHFGDLMVLREMVDAAHDRGMLVILDIVTNHMGQLFFYDINGNGQPDDTLLGGGTHHTCVQRCGSPIQRESCIDDCLFERCRPECIGAEGTGICPPDALESCSEEDCGCDEGCQQECRSRSWCSEGCTEDECTYCREGYSYFERITEWDPEYDPNRIQGWSSLGFSGDAAIRFLYMPEINRTPPAPPPAWFDWPASRGWFDDPVWYNRRGRVYTWWHEAPYSTDFLREQETMADFPGGLKDLNTDHPIVQDALIRSFQYWIEVADFDGFRIDTLKHIDRPELDHNVRGFWGEFCTRMRERAAELGKQNFFMFGEAFDGNDALTGHYSFPGTDERGDFGRLDSVFYFSQKYRVIDNVFVHGGSTNAIESLYNERSTNYYDQPHASPAEGGTGLSPQQSLVNFLDNHDLHRFLFHTDATVEMLYSALFYLLTWDGIPCIYYGTEQLFDGGNDPANREDMFLGNPDPLGEEERVVYAPFDTSHDTFRFVRDMIRMRRDHVALRRGTVNIRWTTSTPANQQRRDAGLFAFERTHDDETLLVVLNTSDDFESETCAPADEGGACMATSFRSGTRLRDISPGNEGYTVTVSGDGTVSVSVPARGGRVLAPE
jgi:glycosidase